MFKKTALVTAGAVLVTVVLLRVVGLRVSRDGSGIWPRLFSSAANYDALEADRARQREQISSAPPVEAVATAGNTDPARVNTTNSVNSVNPGNPGNPVNRGNPDPPPASGRWPDFRGPNRDGRSEEPIRAAWPASGLPLLWKQPIGLGYASFVAADGRAFTIEQRRGKEVVAAYDVATGRELWTNGWDGEFVEIQGGDGPRATPTYYDGRVYALGALGEFRCLDARTGALAWRRNILTDNGASNLDWGMSASPLVVDDTVVVLPGGANGRSVAAYDRLTGEPRWTSLDDKASYTSPMLVTLGGVRQIIVVSATRAMGLTPDRGQLLWEYPWETMQGINVAQPLLVGNDRVFLSASYGHGAAVIQISRSGDTFSVRAAWQNNRMKNKFTSSVLRDGYIYGLDETILACVDAATGDLQWKGGRYGYGQILLAGDHIIVLTEDGDLALVKAAPDRFQEVAMFPAIDGKTWNHPVIVAGRLLVRNLREMAAFDIRP